MKDLNYNQLNKALEIKRTLAGTKQLYNDWHSETIEQQAKLEAYSDILEKLERLGNGALEGLTAEIKASIEVYKTAVETKTRKEKHIKKVITILEKNLNQEYEKVFFSYEDKQIEQIDKGLTNLVDIRKYANDRYTWQQMEQIRQGLEANIDITAYNNPDITAEKMKEIKDIIIRETYS